MRDAYHPDTLEHIPTDTPSAWMKRAGVAVPAYNSATEGCFFRAGAWTIVVSTTQADAHAKEKVAVLEEAREMRAEIFNALMGIKTEDILPSDTAALNAISVARTALKNLPVDPGVVAAIDGPSTHAAVMNAWKTIAANLAAASPAAAVAFKKTAMW